MIAAVWTMFEANAIWIEHDTHLLCFAARWGHEKRTRTWALPDYRGYKRDRRNDKALCKDLFKLLDQADIVVAHNGDAFDIKKINSRLIVNGIGVPSTYKSFDTLKAARKAFKFDSNKLDNLGRYLGEGRKIPNTGAALWRGCVNGDEKSWRIMRRYNAQDVDLLVNVYERIKPWASTHPDMRVYDGRPGCPKCRSTDVQRRGFAVTAVHRYERLQCRACGGWHKGPIVKHKVAK